MSEEQQSPPPSQPLEYAQPGPKARPNLKVLGITFAIPLGLIAGLFSPLIIYSAIISITGLQSGPAAITIFFVCVGGAVCGAIILVKKRNTILNVFIASLFIGGTITILILSACGFK